MPYFKRHDILSLPCIPPGDFRVGIVDYEGGPNEIPVARQVCPDQVIWWKVVIKDDIHYRFRTAEPTQAEEE